MHQLINQFDQGGFGSFYDQYSSALAMSGDADFWDWKSEYGKYFQPYNIRKENILQEMTDEKITGLTDEFGEVNKTIASNIGLTNLDSGRMQSLWGGVKDSLQNKINIAELEEDLGIEGLRNAYERGFYNTAMELGGLMPGMFNPDIDYDTDD